MKKLVFCLGFVALAASFGGYTSDEEEVEYRGNVESIDEDARTVTIDGETYGFTAYFAGKDIRAIICNDCRVMYRLSFGAISHVTNWPTMSWEEEAAIPIPVEEDNKR